MTSSPLLRACLFGAHLPTEGQMMDVLLDQGQLYIAALSMNVQYSDIHAEVGGFDHDQLQLNWQSKGISYVLLISDKTTIKQLTSYPGILKITGLRRWRHTTHRQKRVWQIAIGSIAFCLVVILFTVIEYNRITGWIAQMISIESEQRLGEAALAALKKNQKLVDHGVVVDAMKTIGRQITHHSKYQYRWYIAQDDTVNAFALPGGIVVVNSGLLKQLDNGNELAAVLAHETRHIELKHTLQSTIASAGIASAALLVLGDINSVYLILAHQVTAQHFNRELETQADLGGVDVLRLNHINPNGMVSLLQKLEREESPKQRDDVDTHSAWQIFSSHPETTARITSVQKAIAEKPCVACKNIHFNKANALRNLQQIALDNNHQND